MDDLFGDDAWGEDPDWARDDPVESSSGGDGNDEGTSSAPGITFGAQHVLLLVDCHAGMFENVKVVPPENNDDDDEDVEMAGLESRTVTSTTTTPMDLSLQLTETVLRQRIRDTVTLKIGKRNGVGLLLYDTKPQRAEKDDVAEGGHGGNASSSSTDASGDEEESDHDEEEEGSSVHVLLPLEPPGSKQVKVVRQCLAKKYRNIQTEFGADSSKSEEGDDEDAHHTAPLQTALEEAIRMFRKAPCVREKPSKPNDPIDTRSIWILTNREQPYPSSSHQWIQNVARDAKEQGIQVVVWPLPQKAATEEEVPSFNFNMDLCFREMVSYEAFENRFSSMDGIQEGLDVLQPQWKKVRRVYYGPLWLPGDHQANDQAESTTDDGLLPIMVDWFRLVQLAKKPSQVRVDQYTNRETIRVRQLVDSRGDILASFKTSDTPSEQRAKPQPGLQRIRQYAKFANDLVPMSKQDLSDIRMQANGGENRRNKIGLTLIGFKPMDSIPFYHTMASSYLIYPNDNVIQGSREAFIQLQAAMIRKKVVAIAEVLHREIWTSRLVAIYPGVTGEESDTIEETGEDNNDGSYENNGKRKSPGMVVVTLPFEDDVRSLESDEATRLRDAPTDVKVESGKDSPKSDIIVSCETPSDVVGKNIASEELVQAAMDLMNRQQLQGMELGDDFENAALTEFFNYLESVALEMPVSVEDKEDFDTRLDDETVLEAAREQIDKFQSLLPEDVKKEKSSGIRKRKTVVADNSGLDWEVLYRSETLEDCRVPELKTYLRSVGEPVSGNKASLVARVTQHLRQKLEKTGGNVPIKMEV